jgi:PAS domain S-box-containing protein
MRQSIGQTLWQYFDEKGYFVELNENFCVVTGYRSVDLIGKHHKEVVPKDFVNSAKYRRFWERLRAGEHVEGEFERVAKDGSVLWLSSTYTPVRAGGGAVYQIIKIAQNVTEDYKTRAEIMQQNVYLEHAAKILRHDMHSGINTYMPRGLKGLERRLSEDQIKQLKIGSSMRLLREGLQHTQKVYAGVKEFTNLVKKDAVLEMETKDLRSILVDYLSLTAYTDQVAIDWLPSIPVNEPLFCTAIDNFIRNGLKYNDSETKVVAIMMVDDYHLAIVDNGRGMTEKEFLANSKPYVRGSKNKEKESGSGLGLNISIAILEEHGFTVSCLEQESGTMIKVRIRK